MDQMSTNTAVLFHERRMQTHYLVGLDDLEPLLADLVNDSHLLS